MTKLKDKTVFSRAAIDPRLNGVFSPQKGHTNHLYLLVKN